MLKLENAWILPEQLGQTSLQELGETILHDQDILLTMQKKENVLDRYRLDINPTLPCWIDI